METRIIIPPELASILSIDPEIMHGEICFIGTRVPLTVLLDNLSEGMGIDEFVKYYPSVQRYQIEMVLAWRQEDSGCRET